MISYNIKPTSPVVAGTRILAVDFLGPEGANVSSIDLFYPMTAQLDYVLKNTNRSLNSCDLMGHRMTPA